MNDKTSIAISRDLRDLLAAIGNKDSTFDEIIRKLLNTEGRTNEPIHNKILGDKK